MTTITIELDDEVAARLEADAARGGMRVEELVASLAREHTTAGEVSPEVEAIITRQFERYRDVFQRLSE
jgi:predicted transcriptional regulator